MKKQWFGSFSLITAIIVAAMTSGTISCTPAVTAYASDSQKQQMNSIAVNISHADRMAILAEKKQTLEEAKTALAKAERNAKEAITQNLVDTGAALDSTTNEIISAQTDVDTADKKVIDLKDAIINTEHAIIDQSTLLDELNKEAASPAAIVQAQKDVEYAQAVIAVVQDKLTIAQNSYQAAQTAYDIAIVNNKQKSEAADVLNGIRNDADEMLKSSQKEKEAADAAVTAAQYAYDNSGHWKTVIIKEAWDESFRRGYYMCVNCGTRFYYDETYNGLAPDMAVGLHMIENKANGCNKNFTQLTDETIVHHEAETEEQFLYDESLKPAITEAQDRQAQAITALETAQTAADMAQHNLEISDAELQISMKAEEAAETKLNNAKAEVAVKTTALADAKIDAANKQTLYELLLDKDALIAELTSDLEKMNMDLTNQKMQLTATEKTLTDAKAVLSAKETAYNNAADKQKRAEAVTYDTAFAAVITDPDFTYLNTYITIVKTAQATYNKAETAYETAVLTEGNGIDFADHMIVTDPAVAATCTNTGLTEGSHCSGCGEVIIAQAIIPAIKDVTLSYTSVKYDGKAKTPAATVKDCTGKIIDPRDYEVSYQNNVKAGTATVVVTFSGDYEGTKKLYFRIVSTTNTISASDFTKSYATCAQRFFIGAKALEGAKLTYSSDNKNITVDKNGKVTIAKKYIGKATITIRSLATASYTATTKYITVTANPTRTSLSRVADQKNSKATVKWKKNTVGDGYQIQYSTVSNFSANCKTVIIRKNRTTFGTISGLANGTKYYVRIRTYDKTSGGTFYSGWSGVKTVTANYTPSKTCLSGLKNYSGGKIKIKWKKNTSASGYVVEYAADSRFATNVTSVTVGSYRTTGKTVKVPAKGVRYYARVRAYKTVNGKRYYAGWSAVKSVIVKK